MVNRSSALIAAALAATVLGCSQTCPPGTTLVGGPPPKALSQFCSGSKSTIAHLSTGRSFDGALGIAHPTARGDVVHGPATEWYADGTIKSHGAFTIVEGRSVPDGMWTFWYPSGERRIQGRYAEGTPVGCFGMWDQAGALRTYVHVDGEFVSSDCTVFLDREASELAARYGGPAFEPRDVTLGSERFSFGVEVGASPDQLPLRADELSQPDVDIGQDVRVSLRRRAGPLKLGGVGGVAITGEQHDWRVSFGGLAAITVPLPARRLELELSAQAGARLYSAMPRMDDIRAVRSEKFGVPYAGAEASFGLRLTDGIGVFMLVRAERDLSRTTTRTSKWCGVLSCRLEDATWHVGGAELAAGLQLRFLVD